jgi:GTP cyclohydrolase I
MSRPAEVLNTLADNPLTLDKRKDIATRLKQSLHAKLAVLNFTFTYHVKKESPVSKMKSYMSYSCEMQTVSNGIKSANRTTVHVPVLLLCPCSKAISKQNAHNQRAIITIQVESASSIFLEDLISIAENAASSPLYTILKRPDEKFVTERSYANPKFVEDAVRDVTLKLKRMKTVTAFSVECESQESIHGHNAYARYSQGGLQ